MKVYVSPFATLRLLFRDLKDFWKIEYCWLLLLFPHLIKCNTKHARKWVHTPNIKQIQKSFLSTRFSLGAVMSFIGSMCPRPWCCTSSLKTLPWWRKAGSASVVFKPWLPGFFHELLFLHLYTSCWKRFLLVLLFLHLNTSRLCCVVIHRQWRAISFFSSWYDIDTIWGFFSRYDTIRYDIRAS